MRSDTLVQFPHAYIQQPTHFLAYRVTKLQRGKAMEQEGGRDAAVQLHNNTMTGSNLDYCLVHKQPMHSKFKKKASG